MERASSVDSSDGLPFLRSPAQAVILGFAAEGDGPVVFGICQGACLPRSPPASAFSQIAVFFQDVVGGPGRPTQSKLTGFVLADREGWFHGNGLEHRNSVRDEQTGPLHDDLGDPRREQRPMKWVGYRDHIGVCRSDLDVGAGQIPKGEALVAIDLRQRRHELSSGGQDWIGRKKLQRADSYSRWSPRKDLPKEGELGGKPRLLMV